MYRIPDEITGLSELEATQLSQAGKTNSQQESISKTTLEIVRDNTLTLFNFLNLSIAICLVLVGAFSNLFFMAIIILNVSIGIYQEITARNLVAKLSLLSQEPSTAIRGGKQQQIPPTELVLGDVILLKAGEQVPADAEVIHGRADANESLLTGESDLIVKEAGAELLSGSVITSGTCLARLVRVGPDNYAAKIANEAKVHKPIQSELVAAIRKVARFTSMVIIPLGLALFFEAYLIRQDTIRYSVVSSAAALLGMLPKGLALLISIALATAVIRLAKKKILVQSMYAVETLAHVDTLCLDKTGTITEGRMKLEDVHLLDGIKEELFEKIMASYLHASSDNNITMHAIRQHFQADPVYPASDIIPFSSDRKWGAMYLESIGTVAFGAPERILQGELPQEIIDAQKAGLRALVMAVSQEPSVNGALPAALMPIAAITLQDPIRQNASETLGYLKEQGIDLKVISGDNPQTVSTIAMRAGLPDHENFIDLSTLKDEAEVKKAAFTYTVFGRVSPHQKKLLVQELKQQGRTVAMTGDGVNDILALREADVSIAMAEGDSATRQIANLVLLESDFTSLPDVLLEGRRVVNNVTKVASVFFIKTIYSFLLSILCLVTNIPFPFIPIQITLLDLAIEGYPSFFLSFEGDPAKSRRNFLSNSLKRALPFALVLIANIVFIHFYGLHHHFDELQMTTLMYYMLIGISVMAVVRACLPLNPLRIFLILSTAVGTYGAAFIFYHILEIGHLDSASLPVFAILFIISAILLTLFQKITNKTRKQ